jgi:hypothetical protein
LADRLAKGIARFFNLAVGDKMLLKDNFRTSNVFAKADWILLFHIVCLFKKIRLKNQALKESTSVTVPSLLNISDGLSLEVFLSELQRLHLRENVIKMKK